MKASAAADPASPYFAPGLRLRSRTAGGKILRVWVAAAKDRAIGFDTTYLPFDAATSELDVADLCREMAKRVIAFRLLVGGSAKTAAWHAAPRKFPPDLTGYAGAGMVYFIQSGDHEERIKIGYTLDLEERVQTLGAGCPYPIKILGFHKAPPEAERFLHWKFRHVRIHREWFRPTGEIVNYAARFPMQKEHDAMKARTPVHAVPQVADAP